MGTSAGLTAGAAAADAAAGAFSLSFAGTGDFSLICVTLISVAFEGRVRALGLPGIALIVIAHGVKTPPYCLVRAYPAGEMPVPFEAQIAPRAARSPKLFTLARLKPPAL